MVCSQINVRPNQNFSNLSVAKVINKVSQSIWEYFYSVSKGFLLAKKQSKSFIVFVFLYQNYTKPLCDASTLTITEASISNLDKITLLVILLF